MSNLIETAYVKQYASRVEMLVQQRGSKLASICMNQSFVGKSAQVVQQVGAVEATEILDRHADTELVDTPHAARWVKPRHFGVADMVDEEDLEKVIIDPKSPYAMSQQYALGRKFDDIIIAAAIGSNFTGAEGTTTVTAANDGVDTVVAGGVGLTVEKLREAKRNLMANEVDIDNEEIWCAITAAQHDNLLGQTQVVSGDYNKPVFSTDGKIERFFGINFRHCERLTTSGGERQVLMWAKSGMCAATWNGIRTRVRERSDKWDNIQVASKGTFGATRTQGQKVQIILCVE